MVNFYYKELEGKLFTKNNEEWPKYGIGGLRYRSEVSLKKLILLDIGKSVEINGIEIKRVK